MNVDPAQSSSWLTGAKKAYTHLKLHNNSYINDGNENIIDDYCGLLAAAELYRADGDILYKNDVSERAERIIAKQSDEGWFYSDDQRTRLFYHAAEEGLVLIALAEAVSVTQNSSYKNALKKARDWYVSATRDGKNPFDYVPLQYTPLSGSVNYASNSSVQASSEAVWGTNPASHAVDGDITTSWNSEPGWDNSDTLDTITVDLETIEALTKIAINWGDEYATNFTVEVSADGISWNETGQFSWRSGGVEQISFDEQDVRFIRVICQRWYWYEVWEGQWQSPMFYSIKEITAYGAPETDRSSSFFMPHDNETGYWWQGENARLGSMSAGLVWAELTLKNKLNPTDTVSEIAQAQLDWILGKNTEGICMMTGRGTKGYPTYNAQYGIPNVLGGICNGITGDDDRGGKSPYYFMDTTKSSSWRWIEQWLPHSSWYLMGLSSLQQMKSGSTPIFNEKSSSVKAGTVSLRNIGKRVSLNAAFVNGKNSSFELYDYRGRQIFSKAINSAGITELDLSHVSHGMYVVRVINNGSIMKSQRLRLM